METESKNNTKQLIKYDYLYLDDGSNNEEITNNKNDCFIKCIDDPNCQGLNIISSKLNPNVKCKYLNNICYSNFKKLDSKSIFYKKAFESELENLIPYNIKIAGKNLNEINDKINISDIELTPWVFDKDNSNVKVENKDLCLEVNNSSVSLEKCNTYNPKQKLVYENIYNTIRPVNNLFQCIGLNNSNDNLIVESCGKSLKNEIFFNTYYNNTNNMDIESKENFSTEEDYTLNLTYYTIYMIMLVMILFLVLVISKN